MLTTNANYCLVSRCRNKRVPTSLRNVWKFCQSHNLHLLMSQCSEDQSSSLLGTSLLNYKDWDLVNSADEIYFAVFYLIYILGSNNLWFPRHVPLNSAANAH